MNHNGNGQLPPGWRWARLGELCTREIENRDPRWKPNEHFRYVDIAGVDNTQKTIIEAKTLLGKDAPSRARQVIHSGDILVATTRPNLNAVALVPPELDNEVCSTGFCVLRPLLDVDREFVFSFVQTPDFVAKLSNLVRGALYPAVTDSQVRAQLLAIPSLPEQQRIAAQLRERLAEVARARAAVQAQLEAAQTLPAAHLRSIFQSPEAQRWPRRKLGSLLRLRKDIVHPRNKPTGSAVFVGLEHIESGTGQRTGSINVEMSELTGRKPRFYAGDLVYGYLRPYLNKVWLAEFDGLCSVDQYVYSVNAEEANAEFVAWFMRSPVYLERAPIGTTPGQLPRIRTEEVAMVDINLPSLPEQSEWVARIKTEQQHSRQLHEALASRLAALDLLPAALLRQAFRGEM